MAFSGSQITRLGMYAAPRGLYASFAGKTEAEVVAVTQVKNLGAHGLLGNLSRIGRGL